MKRSSFILTSGIWLLTFGFSLAILDTNNNGQSDFWEREYNAGELFPANFDPQADYDADGWTNDRESTAGTDPHDPNPPDGIIRPATEHVPAVISEVNGVPVVDSPESIKVTWPTLAGKQYTLLYSPDLTQESWLTVGDPFIANGGVSEYIFYEVSATDKCFWRVAVTDVDTDGDGLNDHEEHVFGTDPNLPMTFSNIPDLWLAQNFPSIQGFDPNGDPDGDGINNDQENELGLDPNSFDKTGPVNFGFDEEITDSPDLSFRDDYPSDLYDQTSIPGYSTDGNGNTEGWQAETGQHIEIWDEDDGNPYAELQSHLGAHGLKQEFNMVPGYRYYFIVRYKGRYEYDAYDNAFDLEVEGVSEMRVDGLPAASQGSKKTQSFMDDDEWEAYAEWQYAAVCITAETGGSGLKKITLNLIPKTTTTYGENGQEEITYGGFVDLVPVDIEPAADVAGVIGDVVESNKANSTLKHFVTPKKSDELNQDYVMLKAKGITAEQITAEHANQIVEWDGGEAVPNEPLKRRVKRDETGTGATEVKIKLKQSETVAVQMNVWVTWATIETQDGTPEMKPASSDADKLTLSGKIRYRYTCEPASMFDLTTDVPALSGPFSVQAPGIHPWTGSPLWPGAPIKYDASRQFRVVSRSDVAAVQTALQVFYVDVPNYPTDSIEGNDDPDQSGETRPYLPQGTTAIMLDNDDPFINLPHTLGSATPQATAVQTAQFRQFARAQIGSKWYQCSDYFLSECILKAKRENNKWVDDGSTFALGNTPFPPP